MKTRKEIKAIGKQRFSEFYWPCVGASVLVMLASSILSGVSTTLTNSDGGASISLGINLATLLISGNLAIGLAYFYVQRILGREDIDVGTPFVAGFTGYGRKLGGYLWQVLFTFLWSLLLVIPGIIKSLAYAMTPYILSDCPNVKAQDALKLSMRIMKGHKGQLFGFYLSFIGWGILSLLTCGLLAIFYVSPYMQSSLACWYLEVREEALRNGVITLGQLEGTEPV